MEAIASLDLETTGTWVERDKIIEVGIVKTYSNGETQEYHRFVNPGIPVPPKVLDLTKIPLEKIESAAPFKEYAHEIGEFLQDCVLVGFNHIRFDLVILDRECRDAGHPINLESFVKIDAAKIYHVKERRDLTAAYQFYCQKQLDGAHSALVDAAASLEILWAQAKMYGDGTLESIKDIDYELTEDFLDRDKKIRRWGDELFITFGKYAGKSLTELAKTDAGYLRWILKSDFSDDVKEAIQKSLLEVRSSAMPPFGRS